MDIRAKNRETYKQIAKELGITLLNEEPRFYQNYYDFFNEQVAKNGSLRGVSVFTMEEYLSDQYNNFYRQKIRSLWSNRYFELVKYEDLNYDECLIDECFDKEFRINRENFERFKKRYFDIKSKSPNYLLGIVNARLTDKKLYYNADALIDSYNILFGIADKINSMQIDGKPFSPYEKLLMAQKYLKRIDYMEEEDDKADLSRTIPLSYISGNAVCVWYTNALKLLLDEFGIASARVFSCNDKEDVGHVGLCINIKDEKYGLDMIGFSDPTNAENNPQKMLMSYKEAQDYYKSINQIFRMHGSNVVTMESSIACEFEKNEKRKEKLRRESVKFIFSTKEEIAKIAKHYIESDEFQDALKKLGDRKNVIREALNKNLEDLPFDENKHFSVKLEDIKWGIANFLDECLGKDEEEISHIYFNLAEPFIGDVKTLSQEVKKQYNTEFEKFFPNGQLKKNGVFNFSSTFQMMMDNLGEDKFTSSVTMGFKKMIEKGDPLYEEVLDMKRKLVSTKPLPKGLCKKVSDMMENLLNSDKKEMQ